jgi:CDP-diacylglycerol--glycerol-3-phosphate 3-phosphatidyltransferase
MNSANIITIIRIGCIPGVIVLLWLVDPESSNSYIYANVTDPQGLNRLYCFIAACLFVFAAITDYFDGYLARKYDMVTNLGKLLDPLADKLLVMSAMIMLVELGWLPAWMVIIIVGREISITALRSIASAEGIVMAADNLGKLKTAFQVTALSSLLIHYQINLGSILSVNPHTVGLVLFLIAFVFTIWSGADYFVKFLPLLKKK